MNKQKILKISGGYPLYGTVRTQGSKNASLPVMAAALLLGDRQTLKVFNVPQLRDTETLVALLRSLGLTVECNDDTAMITRSGDIGWETPASLVQKMRASSLVLGPLLAREGKAIMPLPGGCTIGSRPLDLHLKGLAKMGAQIELRRGTVYASANELKGSRIYLDFPSVGATENLVMAGVLAHGETVIENAAREPEIVNLVEALRAMGAKIEISGEGAGMICIQGQPSLSSASIRVIPDRIAACTYLLAGVISNGEVTVEDAIPQHFDSLLAKLEEADVDYSQSDYSVTVYPSRRKLKAISVKTMPYPGFPTDVQPQLLAALTLASGSSIITESIFESRFLHVPELKKMGANIDTQGNTAVVNGVPSLNGVDVTSTDLRAGAALVLAGLAADGETRVHGLQHILRGYQDFDVHLAALGAHICVDEIAFGEDLKGAY